MTSLAIRISKIIWNIKKSFVPKKLKTFLDTHDQI